MTELKEDAIPPEFIRRPRSLRMVPEEILTTTADPTSITLGEKVGILLVPALAVLLAYAVAGLMAGA